MRVLAALLAFSCLLVYYGTSYGLPLRDDGSGLPGTIDHAGLTVVLPCDETNSNNSFIYCQGRLLHEAMTQNLFHDSKTFVDKALKADATVVLQAFNEAFPESDPVDRELLGKFVDKWFLAAGQELDECELTDWTPDPVGFAPLKQRSLTIYNWAISLNDIWKKLCRKMKDDVKIHADRHSLIYVPHEFVIPGGRFREFYYWDAYWIVKGLLASGLKNTAKNMILNFAYMIENHGLIPNGGRVYYLQRSQPPMLTNMVYDYFEATNDVQLLRQVLPTLEKELAYFKKNKQVDVTVDGQSFSVYQYRAGSNTPRPESYREDIKLVEGVKSDAERHRIWRDVASAAESGWDFSSRWFADSENLHTIETTNVVEVDLNAFMCGNLNFLSFLYGKIGDEEKAELYENEYESFRETFQSVFFVEKEAGWYDYNLRTKSHNARFYPANAVPLFTRCYHSLDTILVDKIYNKMEEQGAFNLSSGIPTSLIDTHQQWDFPNGWSPLNHMMVEGLRRSESPRMQQKAYEIAEKWIIGNLLVFLKNQTMWEKYNVRDPFPKVGAGGEYAAQTGFGWSNGVVLDLLVTYSDRINVPESPVFDPSFPQGSDDKNTEPAFRTPGVISTVEQDFDGVGVVLFLLCILVVVMYCFVVLSTSDEGDYLTEVIIPAHPRPHSGKYTVNYV